MLGRLFLLFALVPLVELYILIKIGGHIGALNTIFLVILTALAGAALVRSQGLRTWRQINDSLAAGAVPAEEMIDGLLILVGGVLFLTPGILTDTFALFVLIPFTRNLFKRWLRKRFHRMAASGDIRLHFHGGN